VAVAGSSGGRGVDGTPPPDWLSAGVTSAVLFLRIWLNLMVVPTVFFIALQFLKAVGMAVGVVLFLFLTGVVIACGVLTLDTLWGPLEVLLGLLTVACFAALPVLLLRRLGRFYADKRASDQSLTLDSYWLLIIGWVTFAAVLAEFESGLRYGPFLLLSFVVYKLLLWAGLRFVGRGAREGRNVRLLLLRTFGSRRRSERLLDELEKHWRYVGSIQLVAGADLAASNLELHEFLDFLGGRLGDRFIKGRADLARQVAALDLRPDPDGRFRVNEFFCYDDTWRDTLVTLARASDAVLMDLRGFTEQNRGCVFELEQLVQLVPASKVVFVVDRTTNMDFLAATLDVAWRGMGAHSPNRTARAPVLRVLRVTRQNSRAVRRLLLALFEAARPAASAAEPATASGAV
jgi:hypothetical protein